MQPFSLSLLQDFKLRIVRLMGETNGREGCPWRRQIEELVEVSRWAAREVLSHDPPRMMRVVFDLRSQMLTVADNTPNPELQRQVLVRAAALLSALHRPSSQPASTAWHCAAILTAALAQIGGFRRRNKRQSVSLACNFAVGLTVKSPSSLSLWWLVCNGIMRRVEMLVF